MTSNEIYLWPELEGFYSKMIDITLMLSSLCNWWTKFGFESNYKLHKIVHLKAPTQYHRNEKKFQYTFDRTFTRASRCSVTRRIQSDSSKKQKGPKWWKKLFSFTKSPSYASFATVRSTSASQLNHFADFLPNYVRYNAMCDASSSLANGNNNTCNERPIAAWAKRFKWIFPVMRIPKRCATQVKNNG